MKTVVHAMIPDVTVENETQWHTNKDEYREIPRYRSHTALQHNGNRKNHKEPRQQKSSGYYLRVPKMVRQCKANIAMSDSGNVQQMLTRRHISKAMEKSRDKNPA